MAGTSIEEDVQQADDFISALCVPSKMSPAAAVDFLEGVIARCQSSIEALKEENEDL